MKLANCINILFSVSDKNTVEYQNLNVRKRENAKIIKTLIQILTCSVFRCSGLKVHIKSVQKLNEFRFPKIRLFSPNCLKTELKMFKNWKILSHSGLVKFGFQPLKNPSKNQTVWNWAKSWTSKNQSCSDFERWLYCQVVIYKKGS